MNPSRRLLTLGVVSALLASGLVAAVGSGAAQATTPPWSSDPNDVGSISLFNASGQHVVSGHVTDSPIAAFAEASHAGRVGDSKATLYGALPDANKNPSGWTSVQLSTTTAFPDASAPAPLNSASLPVVDLTGVTLATLVSVLPNTASNAYEGLYELRIKTSGVGQPADATYDATDILVTGTGPSAIWQQLDALTATTVTFSPYPATAAYHGNPVTLTAHATPGVPGIVTFYDGTKVVYALYVNSAGVAAFTYSGYVGGTHHFHVTFVPTSASLYTASTSASDTYSIRAVPTALRIRASASSVVYKHTLVLTSTVTPTAPGTLRMYRNGKLWYLHAISSSFAFAYASLPVGTDSFKSTFTPSVPTSFVASTSNTIVVKIVK
jgi:hypothetical protein